MNTLFFELLRISVGSADSFSNPPTVDEWKLLYETARKQALLGVCFAGLQRLGASPGSANTSLNITDDLFFTWMGVAAMIQQRNEEVNQRCADLQAQLHRDGFRSCTLKGQGVAQLYSEPLRMLRQSGDIDIWVEGDRDRVLDYFRSKGAHVSYTSIKHAQVELFSDTEVEVHSRPTWFYSPIRDRKLMRWVKLQKDAQFGKNPSDGIVSPTADFNLVFLLLHIYRHLFEEGIGLRQIMDYYFVLTNSSKEERSRAIVVLQELNLVRFTGALMYVLRTVFRTDSQLLLYEPNEKYGSFLLNEIMQGGNFGKFDHRNNVRKENRIARGLDNIKRNLRFITSYPSEIIWSPFWKIWHWGWRTKRGYIE